MCLKIQRQVFDISLFKTSERRCSFPTEQEGAVLPCSIIQHYYYLPILLYLLLHTCSYFYFKHSSTFRNEYVWTMKTQGILKELTSLCLKKICKFYYKHHETDMQIFNHAGCNYTNQCSNPQRSQLSYTLH